MIDTLIPVLPKALVGMLPAFGFGGFAEAPVRLRPVKAPPTNTLRFILDSFPGCVGNPPQPRQANPKLPRPGAFSREELEPRFHALRIRKVRVRLLSPMDVALA